MRKVKSITITEDFEKLLLDEQRTNIRWFVEELYYHYPSDRMKIIADIKDINEVL